MIKNHSSSFVIVTTIKFYLLYIILFFHFTVTFTTLNFYLIHLIILFFFHLILYLRYLRWFNLNLILLFVLLHLFFELLLANFGRLFNPFSRGFSFLLDDLASRYFLNALEVLFQVVNFHRSFGIFG